jgi:hypothetical protein
MVSLIGSMLQSGTFDGSLLAGNMLLPSVMIFTVRSMINHDVQFSAFLRLCADPDPIISHRIPVVTKDLCFPSMEKVGVWFKAIKLPLKLGSVWWVLVILQHGNHFIEACTMLIIRREYPPFTADILQSEVLVS